RSRSRIAAIDQEIERFARAQLSEVPGQRVRPAELAQSIVASRSRFEWFSDRPKMFWADTGFANDAIAQLRKARLALAERIEHLTAEFPSNSDLPSARALGQLHADIVRANELKAEVSNAPPVTLRINSPEALAFAHKAADAIELIMKSVAHLATFP